MLTLRLDTDIVQAGDNIGSIPTRQKCRTRHNRYYQTLFHKVHKGDRESESQGVETGFSPPSVPLPPGNFPFIYTLTP